MGTFLQICITIIILKQIIDKDDFFYEIFGVDNNTSDNLEIEEYLKNPVEHIMVEADKIIFSLV
ncbi:hypothetical protein RhiirA4_483235 [Rhizophagus irregularis]|uniref:Uncharacterized protein n=1 Tax=Rhizophagus irregularis TaxID=588596 RepID=A0A2I1HMA8_9GLOM|nr:hypothetical protein RhiirA4_483235 [Rhizophagus irregularis]